MLGVWGDESDGSGLGTIHVFFPALESDTPRPAHLSEDEMRTLYEQGLRPCIAQTLPEAARDWPPSYPYELHNPPSAAGANSYAGTRAFRSVTLPPTSLGDFVSNFRLQLQLNNVEWADGLFFLHRVCGMKSATRHQNTRKSARLAFSKAFEMARIPVKATNYGNWWIDVGLEFCSDRGESLQWITEHHHRIVKGVLKIPSRRARHITTLGHHRYRRDISCHLPEMSGCAIDLGMRHGPFYATYLQLCTVTAEMSETEHLDMGRALSIRQAMYIIQPAQTVLDMVEVLHNQAETEGSSRTNARIEVRVSISCFDNILVDVDEATVRESLLSFPTLELM